MFDIGRVIEKRIALSQPYLTPIANAAIRKKHEIEIRVLRTAPRDKQKLMRAIQRKKDQIEKISDIVKAWHYYHELQALEWLLPKVRLQDSYHTEDDFV